MMKTDIQVNDRQIIHLSYNEEEYPGWKPGEVVAGPLVAPDGNTYHFTGTATVEGVVLNAARNYDIQIVHIPG